MITWETAEEEAQVVLNFNSDIINLPMAHQMLADYCDFMTLATSSSDIGKVTFMKIFKQQLITTSGDHS